MPITLGTNISSLKTQRQLGKTTDQLSRVFERLSSGQRINHASDDAAGLAISSQLNSSARVFGQALRNVNDGASVLNVAEGATQQLTTILQRQKELATQSANGTYGTAQRSALQEESNRLTSEFNRIIATTTFNGVNVLDGSAGQLQLQVGINSSVNSTIGVDLAGLAITSSSTNGTPNQTAQSGSREWDIFNFASLGKIEEVSSIYIDGDGASILNFGGGPADYVGFTSVDSSGVKTNYYLWFNVGGAMTDPGAAGVGIEVSLTGLENQDELGAAITNALSGNSDINASYLGGGQVQIANVMSGNVTDTHSSSAGLTVTVNQQGDNINSSYFQFSTPTTNYYAWFNNGSGTDPHIAGRTGIAINYTPIDYLDGYTSVLSSAISAIGAALGAQATVNSLSGPSSLDIRPTAQGAVTAPNVSGMGGLMSVVRSIVGTDPSVNAAADTFTIANHPYTTGQAITLSTSGVLPTGLSAATTYYAIVVDSSTIKFATSLANAQSGTAVNITNSGSGTFTLTAGATTTSNSSAYINNLDLSSQDSARSALDTITTQNQLVSTSLGTIGAAQSRLGSVLGTLSVARENYLAAAARITDVDVAAESAALVRGQILQQAAASVLAQANQQPSLALTLLRG